MFPQFPPPAFRNHVELLLSLYVDLSQRMLAAAQSLTEINLQLGRDLLAEAGQQARQLPPGSHALAVYQQRLAELLSRCNSDFNRTTARHLPAVSRSADALTGEMVQQAAARTSRAAEQLARFQAGSQLRH